MAFPCIRPPSIQPHSLTMIYHGNMCNCSDMSFHNRMHQNHSNGTGQNNGFCMCTESALVQRRSMEWMNGRDCAIACSRLFPNPLSGDIVVIQPANGQKTLQINVKNNIKNTNKIIKKRRNDKLIFVSTKKIRWNARLHMGLVGMVGMKGTMMPKPSGRMQCSTTMDSKHVLPEWMQSKEVNGRKRNYTLWAHEWLCTGHCPDHSLSTSSLKPVGNSTRIFNTKTLFLLFIQRYFRICFVILLNLLFV